jgi:hypothetical protein
MSKPLIELFRAEWCGYCKRFEPDWKKLTEMDDIECEKYEHTDPKDKEHFAKNDVQGYPTIYITVNDKKEIYMGKRSVNHIMNYICKKMPNASGCDKKYPLDKEDPQEGGCGHMQNGGDCGCGQGGGKKKSKKTKNVDDAKYELKYYKYKAKYLKIKDK